MCCAPCATCGNELWLGWIYSSPGCCHHPSHFLIKFRTEIRKLVAPFLFAHLIKVWGRGQKRDGDGGRFRRETNLLSSFFSCANKRVIMENNGNRVHIQKSVWLWTSVSKKKGSEEEKKRSWINYAEGSCVTSCDFNDAVRRGMKENWNWKSVKSSDGILDSWNSSCLTNDFGSVWEQLTNSCK